MTHSCHRRDFLRQAAGCSLAAASLPLLPDTASADLPQGEPHTLTVISGKPRERGRQYGEKYKQRLRFVPGSKKTLPYAAACGKAIRAYSPEIMEEMEGMAEGSGLKLEEVIVNTLHEELYHNGEIPSVDHCTAMAAGPPDTREKKSYVGMNWDWNAGSFGLSAMLLWKRSEGPSVLAYSFPGLWVGAGLNSAGIALSWTSTAGHGIKGPVVGIPTYALIPHLLYQDTLDGVIKEMERAKKFGGHAGWFTFVMADSKGQLLNIEGIPGKYVVEKHQGHLARVYCGSHEMTGTPKGQPVRYHPQCARMYELLAGSKGKLDTPTVQGFFADHKSSICKHSGTLDSMVFDCTAKEAYVHRGPPCRGNWQKFGFGG